MIQRIQTVYLLIADILIGVLFFLPLAQLSSKDGTVYHAGIQGIYLEGVQKPQLILHNQTLFIGWMFTLVMVLATILLFKHRKLQGRLALVDFLLSLCVVGLIYLEGYLGAQRLISQYALTIYSGFSVIAAILIYLAMRAIKKDELLIRSIDRIR